jgi:hypothetical protein
MEMKMLKQKLTNMLIVLAFISCKPEAESDTKIIHGFDGSQIAQGVFLIGPPGTGGNCTGTAVSTTTILTAAHCIAGNTMCVFLDHDSRGRKNCLGIARVGREFQSQGMSGDYAAIIFPTPIFEHFHPIATEAAKPGDDLTLVGFSPSDDRYQQKTRQGMPKRWGVNRISSIAADRQIISRTDRSPNRAGLNGGDSGGPALNERCEVVGVASTIQHDGNGTIHTGRHANVSLPTLRQTDGFFDRFKTSLKAQFCGVNADDSFCPAERMAKKRVVSNVAEFPCVYGATSSPQPPRSQNHPIFLAQNGDRTMMAVPGSIQDLLVCSKGNVEECQNQGSDVGARLYHRSPTLAFYEVDRTVASMDALMLVLVDKDTKATGYRLGVTKK